MDFSYILETFVKTLSGIPVTLGIMVISILLSFFPALFLALGRIYKVKGVTGFSVIYLAFIRSTPAILLILFFYSQNQLHIIHFQLLLFRIHQFYCLIFYLNYPCFTPYNKFIECISRILLIIGLIVTLSTVYCLLSYISEQST